MARIVSGWMTVFWAKENPYSLLTLARFYDRYFFATQCHNRETPLTHKPGDDRLALLSRSFLCKLTLHNLEIVKCRAWTSYEPIS